MRLFRYGPAGREKPGMLDADGAMRCLAGMVADIDADVVTPAGLDRLRAIDPSSLPRIDEGERLGVCIGATGKIVGVGMNYRDHARQAGITEPARPTFFFKPASSLCGPNDALIRPRGSTHLDWEVELAVIIGRVTHCIEPASAADAIAGYTIMNDVTEREWINRSGQMLDGKSADTFSPLGPWLATPDEIADPNDMTLELSVNGKVMQKGNSADMIFRLPEIISRLSHIMTLLPGDVVTTGTPAGIGMRMTPQTYLQPGDEVHLTITGLGEQRQTVVQA